MKSIQTDKPNSLTVSGLAVFANSLDLAAIKFKLMKEKGWTQERVDRIEPQYKAFLYLIKQKGKDTMVPSLDIDEMWHMHILDTRKYMADCKEHLGEYIHHYPYLGMKDEEDAARSKKLFEATQAKLWSHLGDTSSDVQAADCGGGCSSSCGGASCGHGGSSCGHSSGDSGHGDSGGGQGGGDHGHGHGHGHGNIGNGNDGSSILPYSSCGTSGDTPRKREERKPTRAPPRPTPDRPDPRRKGIISRILGLSPGSEEERWYASVTPEMFEQDAFRPDNTILKNLNVKPTIH